MLLKIGVVGYTHSRFNIDKARSALMCAVSKIANHFKPADIDIVSGLTNLGIPKLAYEFADRCGYTTVGISAKEAKKEHCGFFPVDDIKLIGECYGDESSYFVDQIEALVRIGGGQQSHKEVELFRQKCEQIGWDIGERLIEKEI